MSSRIEGESVHVRGSRGEIGESSASASVEVEVEVEVLAVEKLSRDMLPLSGKDQIVVLGPDSEQKAARSCCFFCCC